MKSFFARTARLLIVLTMMFYQSPALSVASAGGPSALPGAALEVSIDKFDVATAFDVVYNWTLSKTATPDSFVLATGQTGTTTYRVAVTKTAHSTFSITYTVTIENKGPGTADFDLNAVIQTPSGSTTYANEFLEHVTLTQGSVYSKTHTTSFDITGVAADIDPLKIGVEINNSGATVGNVKHKTSPAVNFAATPTNTYNQDIVITDDYALATGSPWTFTDTGFVEYTRIFSAGTLGTQLYVNTVTSDLLDHQTPSILTDSATVTVTTSNTAPSANNQSVTTPEDTPIDITLTGSDPDSDPLTFALVDLPAHGVLTLVSPGVYTYTPNADYNGSDSFTFRSNDGHENSALATVSITVSPVNDAPVATDEYITVVEGGNYPVLPDVAQLDATDVDNLLSQLTFSLTTLPAHGVAVVNPDGTFTYVHDGSETTADEFTFTVSDGDKTDTATVHVRVTSSNDGPVALDEFITVLEGGNYPVLPALAQLDATDPDSPLASLVFAIATTPAHGSAVVNADGTFTYTHDGSETLTDSFTFTVTDDGLLTDTGTVFITVTPVNDPPVVSDVNISVSEGGIIDGWLLATDPDDTVFTFTHVVSTTNGTLTVYPNGYYTYEHNGSETTSDSFTYRANDGDLLSNIATVNITVIPVNDPPVVLDGVLTVVEGTSGNGTLNGSDPDTASISYAEVITTAHGTLTVYPNGDYTYTHDGSETTSDSFTFRAFDGFLFSNTGTITITITPDNDAPVADDKYITVVEGARYPLFPMLDQLTATDPDTLFANLVFSLENAPSYGTVVLNPDGTFSYTSDGTEVDSDYFDFSVYDGEFSDTARVYITISAENDAPVALDQHITVFEGGIYPIFPTIGQLGATDTDTLFALLNFVLLTPAANGTVVINPNGTFTYTHDGSETLTDSFEFQVFDDGFLSDVGRVTIDITPVNDPPVVYDDTIYVNEGDDVNGQLFATDPDNVIHTFEWIDYPDHGILNLNAAGDFVYTHDGSENFIDSFTYRAYDGEAYSNVATVTIMVTPANDAPVAIDDSFTVLEDGIHNDYLMWTDPDLFFPVGFSPLLIPFGMSFEIVQQPLYGSIVFTSPFGDYQYDHDGSENFTDYFTFRVYDGFAWSNVARVDITITPVNDAPVVVDQNLNVDEAGTLPGQLSATDPDDTEFTFSWVDYPDYGSLVVNPDGSFTYIHDGSENFTDSFTYKANDGEADSNVATVYITINPINDDPVAFDDGFTVIEDGIYNGQLTGFDPDTLQTLWTFHLVELPENGTLTLYPDGSFIYDHDGSETTVDSFTFYISDGQGNSNIALIDILITPDNDAPVAENFAFTLLQGALAGYNLVASDVDSAQLTFEVVGLPAHGLLVLNPDGSFVYDNDGISAADDSFTFRVFDGEDYSNTATVTITVTPLPAVNVAPVTLPEAFTIPEGGTEFGAVAGVDADGDPITFILVDTVANGTLVFAANGAYTYVHNGTETTTDSFRFRAFDGKAYSAIRTAVITITPVNDAPVAVNGSDETEFETPLTGNIHNLVSDIDSVNWSVSVVNDVDHGTLVLNADGTFTYTPDTGYFGDDQFTFKANDGTLDSNNATFTITVNEDVIIVDPETPLTPLDFWWLYLLGLLLLLLFFLRPNLKYALVDKEGNQKTIRRHIFAKKDEDLSVDLNDKNVQGLVAIDLVVYKQLVKKERGQKITFNLFKKPVKTIVVPEDMKEKIEDSIKL